MQLDYGTGGRFGLSYSRRQTLHSCPRKFELDNVLGLNVRVDTVTFSYGHAVAAGIQEYLSSGNMHLAIFKTTLFYTQNWEDVGTPSDLRNKKSVWYAVHAVRQFIKQLDESVLTNSISMLREYEVATLLDGKPAVELQFRIEMGSADTQESQGQDIIASDAPVEQYVYEGHIDLILRHKKSGKYAILELKTTSLRNLHDAMYANSDQALSYSIVLDRLVGSAQASYDVIYLIYISGAQEYQIKRFPKTAKQRLDWINNLIRDTELLDYYHGSSEELGIPYPTNGSSCYNFFKPCEYFGVCGMENSSLLMLKPANAKQAAFEYADNAALVFTLDEIINSQVDRIEEEGYKLTNYTEEVNDGTVIEL